MGKITEALKKVADERLQRIEKINKIKEQDRLVIQKMESSEIDSRLISYFDPKAIITEQYKVLRTNILSMNKGNPPKVIVVSSSLHSEGKTITALNVSIVMAQETRRPKILLVDGDLRRGKISKYLGVKNKIGLSEILQGQATLNDAIFSIGVDNLSFITTGSTPANPVELLSSAHMHSFLADIKEKFDYVLIDSPPVIPVTDPGILGSQADGVLLVIKAGRTQRGIVQHASELLSQARAKILGHVLTNIEYHLPEYIYRYL